MGISDNVLFVTGHASHKASWLFLSLSHTSMTKPNDTASPPSPLHAPTTMQEEHGSLDGTMGKVALPLSVLVVCSGRGQDTRVRCAQESMLLLINHDSMMGPREAGSKGSMVISGALRGQ